MKDPAELFDIDIRYRLVAILLISIIYVGMKSTGRDARAYTHARMHAEFVGKRLNWSDYPLIHKEIATSIS